MQVPGDSGVVDDMDHSPRGCCVADHPSRVIGAVHVIHVAHRNHGSARCYWSFCANIVRANIVACKKRAHFLRTRLKSKLQLLSKGKKKLHQTHTTIAASALPGRNSPQIPAHPGIPKS
jgi:hypothetical protein